MTWNDYGESHYIGPYNTPHTDDSSSAWAAGLDHTAMLDFAVPYIKAFKAGETAPVIEEEMLVYWYRPHLKSASCDSTDNCGSKPTGWDFLGDTVFVATMTKSGGTVKVTSGNNQAVVQQLEAGVQMIEVPMGVGEQTFEFVTFQGGYGKTTSNVTISADCWVSFPCVQRATLILFVRTASTTSITTLVLLLAKEFAFVWLLTII